MVHRETPVVKEEVEHPTVYIRKTRRNRQSLRVCPLAAAMIGFTAAQRNNHYATEYDQKRLKRHILAATNPK
ncbi:hypothetical protein [Pseudomonas sp.]|uniref:hypothetical protein n=1 Tax=Pseudomonas sp. TaxID=306 RepID=UPI003C68C15A